MLGLNVDRDVVLCLLLRVFIIYYLLRWATGPPQKQKLPTEIKALFRSLRSLATELYISKLVHRVRVALKAPDFCRTAESRALIVQIRNESRVWSVFEPRTEAPK